MNCSEMQELLMVYWDLPESDERRIAANAHIIHCSRCREEFNIWKESTELIRSSIIDIRQSEPATLTGKVMDRIYDDESWRIPVPDRVYSISYRLRKKLTAVIASCFALFIFGFLYSLIAVETPGAQDFAENVQFGLQPVASATGGSAGTIQSVKLLASISPQDPFTLKVGPIHTVPDYMLALSLLGTICTLLIMNWFTRTRA